MPGEEGSEPTGPDPKLQLPRGATGSGSAQTSTTPVTRLIVTKRLLQVAPHPGDKASFLSWKWSSLIAVRAISKPLYEGFRITLKITFVRVSENHDCLMKIWSLQIRPTQMLALLCKDEACALFEISGGRKRPSSMARTFASTNGSERDKPLESVTGTKIRRHQTHASNFDKGTKMQRSMRQELVNAKVKEFERQSTRTKSHHGTCDSI